MFTNKDLGKRSIEEENDRKKQLERLEIIKQALNKLTIEEEKILRNYFINN